MYMAISVWYCIILLRWSSWMINIPLHLWNKVTMPYWSSSWLMLCDKMILLFLEEGIEGKVELRSKKIIFLSIFTHLQPFKTEVDFLNSVYEEAAWQRFVIYFCVPNLWGEHAELNLICFHSHHNGGSCCAPKQNEGLLLHKLVFAFGLRFYKMCHMSSGCFHTEKENGGFAYVCLLSDQWTRLFIGSIHQCQHFWFNEFCLFQISGNLLFY